MGMKVVEKRLSQSLSQAYRHARVPNGRMQCFASASVMALALGRYPRAARRHMPRLIAALAAIQ